MLKLLDHIPILGTYVVSPVLDLAHFTINTIQYILGL
jgi:hypothetical protein